jgi:hypothetical protein
MANTNAKDLAGSRYGMLTVICAAKVDVFAHKTKGTAWVCRCDCGKTVEKLGKYMLSGETKSCGCLARQTARARMASSNNPAKLRASRVRWVD